MATQQPTPMMTDKVRVILVREGKTIYDSTADEKKPTFTYDSQPLKFCPDCGGETVPIFYVCKDCGKRYIKQLESVSGKTLIVALDEQAAEKQNIPIPP